MIYNRYSDKLLLKLKNTADIYSKLIFTKVGELEAAQYLETEEHYRSVPAEGFAPLDAGRRWGGEWQTMWVTGKATVPECADGKKLFCVARTNAYEILFFVNGKPCGIFNSKNDFIGAMHCAELICENAKAGDTYDLAFECYAGHFTTGAAPYSNYGCETSNNAAFIRTYEGIDICVMDEIVKDFVFDLTALLQLAIKLPADNFLRADARCALESVHAELLRFPLDHTSEAWHESLMRCREIMAKVLCRKADDDTRGYVGIIGHSHMDTAWLWPISETVRKCARTYANALSLMEQYPEYKFIQSSALHLDWMRRYYPDIFEGIKKRVAEGRYEPNGGVWVECDCNITSGEAMVRQFLLGQRFTRKHFNYTSDTFWLPDTFGYNAAIPQIMRECGVKYFCTTKMSWNDLNDFPLDTFIWRGLDGSEVTTHLNLMHRFPDAEQVIFAAGSIKHRQVYDGKLIAYGFGDGGGGPTYGMLEAARRVTGLAGMPTVEETTVSDFMKRIETDAKDLPIYSGELYLELHRGTLTQMHDIKRNNRKAETALHNMELLAVLAGSGKSECSDELWECLLKNQFHDILPGTSISCVNDLARREVTDVIARADAETARLASGLTEEGNCITVINPLSFEREDLVYLDAPIGQPITDICGRERYVADIGELPAYGARSIELRDLPTDLSLKFDYDEASKIVHTRFVTVTLDDNGYISSLKYNQTGREIRREGGAPLNKFYLTEDIPNNYDNWDIDYDVFLKKPSRVEFLGSKLVACGAYELRIRSEYAIGDNSHLTQDMIFNSKSPRIDFHTLIDWKEKHALLKVGFDVDISSPTVKNEIQFGHMDRPTTRNNSIEAAKFEVCNHKWTDISESRFGVALLNDCKYGISVEGSDMRLSLHRGGCRPDTTGDEGVHELTYSLLPHEGAFGAENVVRPAYMLNYAPIVVPGKLTSELTPLIKISESNIICEAVKPAEDIPNAYIARLYECERCRTSCELTLAPDVKEAYIVNMLEEVKERLDIVDGKVTIDFKPFKIVSLMLVR
ncbi:MAG: alpha-mannosidase [Clostridia bacterium]|nr:alpha-mannosidase [Clostridia bacterium]